MPIRTRTGGCSHLGCGSGGPCSRSLAVAVALLLRSQLQLHPTTTSSTTATAAKGNTKDATVSKEDIIADAYRLIALHRASAKMKLVHSSNGILMVTDSFSPPNTPELSTAKRCRSKRKRQFGSIRCSKCNKFGILDECCEGATYHVVVRVKRYVFFTLPFNTNNTLKQTQYPPQSSTSNPQYIGKTIVCNV